MRNTCLEADTGHHSYPRRHVKPVFTQQKQKQDTTSPFGCCTIYTHDPTLMFVSEYVRVCKLLRAKACVVFFFFFFKFI